MHAYMRCFTLLVTCSTLSDPSNGMVDCSLGNDKVPSYEDTCKFTCNTGYNLTGSESRTCQSNGTWSGNVTMCIGGKWFIHHGQLLFLNYVFV